MFFLMTNGYPAQLLRTIDLVPNTGRNREAAERQIAPAIEAFLSDVNAFLDSQEYTPPKTKVDLVSHSMGGLSTRWYAAVVAPDRVDTWISLAGANHGTDVLCPFVGSDDGGADDCCPPYSTDPDDTVQLTLNGQPFVADVDETPYGMGVDSPGVAVVRPDAGRRIFYATIRTEPDAWISPGDSVIVDGAGGRPVSLAEGFPAVETSPGNFLMINGVTHDSMPGDWHTIQLVALLLNAVEPQRPPVADAGPDQVVSAGAGCQATVTLDGTASAHPNGDTLTYAWMGTFGTASSPTLTVTLPRGSHAITLTVDDGSGGVASDTLVVNVQDTMPPVLGNVPGPIVVGQTGVDGTPATVPLPSGTDNCGDVALMSDAPALFPLGTTTVIFTAKDPAGNTSTAATTVTVVETPGRRHGHGHLDMGSERHHFEFQVLERPNGAERGRLEYRVNSRRARPDRGNGANRFTSTAVTAVVFLDEPTITSGRRPDPSVDTVIFRGIGRWNGAPGYTFEARATDGGEPGRGRDSFMITITAPDGAIVATASGTLSGGNIQSLRLRP